jgi:hypothetical protein
MEARISSTCQAGGDQLGAAGEVDAVEARPLHRRAGDPHVHLGGARLAQHPHQRPLGVAPHDGVVDDDQPLAAMTSRSGFSLSRMPSWRIVCDGWMNVRPT